MIHVITSNPIDNTNIQDYIENFVLSHVTQRVMLPVADRSMGYHFKIYHQDGMDLSEYLEYLDSPNFKYEFISVATIPQALEMIIQDVATDELDLELDGEDNDCQPDELTLAVCTHSIRLTTKMCIYMNRLLQEEESEVKTLNLFQYLKKSKITEIADIVKMQLQLSMIYPDDPVAFSYVLNRVLNGDYT